MSASWPPTSCEHPPWRGSLLPLGCEAAPKDGYTLKSPATGSNSNRRQRQSRERFGTVGLFFHQPVHEQPYQHPAPFTLG
ncbi:hypothetical protein EPZ47_00310 [Pseudomonas viciae]|uniref:Uncharacterized protein n=1 Tax=Pseudomonas viciae TaxID=2505979 RepID=A0A4P7PA37_9PSED|nr:hypothetical protein EPZ47_00310 [Pseudomonas viciae]